MDLDPNEPQPPPLPHEREAVRKVEEAKALQAQADAPSTGKKRLVQKRRKAKDRTPPPKNAKVAPAAPVPPTPSAETPEPGSSTPTKSIDPAKQLEILTPGEKFGDFQILKCLSYDLVGSLYRVRKAREKTERTLYVLPPALSEYPDFAERFQEARERLFGMDHPDIISPQESLQIKGRLAFVGEGMTAVNLADYFETEGKESKDGSVFALSTADVRGVLERIASTLQYAHNKQLRHLNLNPANILRTPDGRVLINGFGLVEIIGPELFRTIANAALPPLLLETAQVRINTQDIQPPEAKRGDLAGETGDFYALGVLAYWMLTGKKPERDYKPPSQIRAGLAQGWDLIVAKCLEPSPKKRYTNAAQLLEDLERVDSLKIAGGRKAVPGAESAIWLTLNKQLKFVPLPLAMTQRGSKLSALVRVGAVVAVFALITGAMGFITSIATRTDPQEVPIVQRVTGGMKANVRLEVEPDRFQVIGPDGKTLLGTNSVMDLLVQEGRHRLSLRAPGYRDEAIFVEGGKTLQTKQVTLAEAFAQVTIQTKPGALIAYRIGEGEWQPAGVASETGVLSITDTLKPGTHDFAASLEGHEANVLEAVELQIDANNLQLDLSPQPGTLRVRSEPQGAIIERNGQEVGVTNFTIQSLPVDQEFVLTARKPGYVTESRAITLDPGTRTWLDFGELRLATFAIEPEIIINGEAPSAEALARATLRIQSDNPAAPDLIEVNLNPEGKSIERLRELPAGTITVSLEHPEWESFERTFDATLNANVRLKADLLTKPGRIELRPQPDNFPISLRRPGSSSTPLDGQRAFSVPSLREQSITLEMPNHLPETVNFYLEPGESRVIDVTFQRRPGPQPQQSFQVPGLSLELAWIPADKFTMGSPPSENSRLPFEGPETVIVFSKPFWMATQETTQSLYRQVTRESPSQLVGSRNPVDSVTFEDAREFCRRLHEREMAGGRVPPGYEYRLPTEAEWEFAARGGTVTPYHWGSQASPADGAFQGRYPRRFGGQIDTNEVGGPSGHMPVASYQPNRYGLYDMHGNVAEWCLDFYNARLPGDVQRDWVRTTRSSRRVIRGGSWRNFAKDARAAVREDNMIPNGSRDDVGFRVVLGPIIDID